MGKLFVIDGTDGSGKQTQFEKLCTKLDKEKIKYKKLSFPRYANESSSLVKMYLSGEFGKNAKEISPYIASTFYAVDRYASFKQDFEEYYRNGGIVIADRYTTSNMIHQAGKIREKVEREKFLDWLWDFEYNLYGIPIPTQVFFLNMPTEYALKLMENRENKITGQAKKDIHESDADHMKDAYNVACELAKKYSWKEIKCIEKEEIKSVEKIHKEIYEEFMKLGVK